jgi:hypothetical protein
LGTSQSVFNAVVGYRKPADAMRSEIEQVPLFHAANASCSAKPQVLAVIGDMRDVITQEAIVHREAGELSIAIGAQAAGEGPDPQRALLIFIQRPDSVAG